MALWDFVPVVLFFVATCLIMHDIYHLASKGAFSLIAAGFIMVSCAGFYKAVWKLLYAMKLCDFQALNHAFFPMQSTGFILAGIGMMAIHLFPQKERIAVMAIVPVYASVILFVIFTILGDAGIYLSLILFARKMRKRGLIILLVISLIMMLGMGYLSSRNFMEPLWNLIGEGVNTVGQIILLLSVLILHRNGFDRLEMNRNDRL